MARILVIDDDASVRAILERILKAAQHQVVLAAEGQEAILQSCAAPVDLVVTDLFMPGMDGFEFITDFRRRFPQTPIIAMSGNSLAEPMLSLARKLGVLEILSKPFNRESLQAALAKALPQRPPV